MRLRSAAAAGVAVLLAGAGIITGCGASTGGDSPPGATETATQPVVTAVPEQTVPEQDLPGYKKPVVYVGNANTPEQFIIGELWQLALEHEGYTVVQRNNIGEPSVHLTALQQGRLDVYPEYVDEWDSAVANLHEHFRSAKAAYRAAGTYARGHGFALLKPAPFSDTWGLAVTSQYAQLNHVHSISDLTKGATVTLGAPLEFELGLLPEVEKAYRLQPFVQGMDVGAQYTRLDSGNLQAAWADTTDPQLLSPHYQLLSDPKHVFGFGNMIPVTAPQVLKAEGDAFSQTINSVDALLTLRAVRGLNAEYSLGGHDATSIAKQFLQGNGILPASRFAPVTTTSTSASGP